ncbi:MAG: hypothetical protein VKI82_09630 [Leptolyngbya sp.]|nr:hypothetical protein [Leptolyngbya sp.]
MPAQLAQADATLAAMLERLQDCGLKRVSTERPSLWHLGRRLWPFLRQSLQRRRMGSV